MRGNLDASIGTLPDGTVIRGRQRVRVACALCNRVIGKVMDDPQWGAWINLYSHPGTRMADSRDGAGRVEAPAIVLSSRLQGPGHPSRRAWCSRDHVEREVEMGRVCGALARARETGGIGRIAV